MFVQFCLLLLVFVATNISTNVIQLRSQQAVSSLIQIVQNNSRNIFDETVILLHYECTFDNNTCTEPMLNTKSELWRLFRTFCDIPELFVDGPYAHRFGYKITQNHTHYFVEHPCNWFGIHCDIGAVTINSIKNFQNIHWKEFPLSVRLLHITIDDNHRVSQFNLFPLTEIAKSVELEFLTLKCSNSVFYFNPYQNTTNSLPFLATSIQYLNIEAVSVNNLNELWTIGKALDTVIITVYNQDAIMDFRNVNKAKNLMKFKTNKFLPEHALGHSFVRRYEHGQCVFYSRNHPFITGIKGIQHGFTHAQQYAHTANSVAETDYSDIASTTASMFGHSNAATAGSIFAEREI